VKRTLIALALVTVIVAAGLLGYQRISGSRAAAEPALRTIPVQRGTLIATVNAAGNIAAKAETTLGFRIGGQLRAVHVSLGDHVEEGKVLMQLDTTDLELDVAKARLSLVTAEAQLAKAQTGPSAAELAAAHSSLESARENLAKVQAGPSQEQIAAVEAALQSASQRYQELLAGPSEDQLASATANLEKARLALQEAQAQFADKSDDPEARSAAEEAYHRAIIDYEVALANYNLATQGPSESDLQNALAQLRQAEDNLEKLRASPTAAELAAAEAQVAQAESQLEKLSAGPTSEDLAIAEAQVEQARLSLQQAERRLQEATLVAPFSGTVTEINYRIGEYVSANQPVVTLTDLSSLEIEVPVAEVDVTRVQPGQMAQIMLDAIPDVVVHGQVSYIDPVADIAQGVVNYPVKIEIEHPDASVRPGMTATVRIVVEQRQDVLLVPTLAVATRGPEQVVRVMREGQVVEVPVTLGAANETLTEVISGLDEGDMVVLSAGAGDLGTSLPRGGMFGLGGGRPSGAAGSQVPRNPR